MLTGEVEQKVTADMMIEFIGQDGAKTCEELAGGNRNGAAGTR